MVKRLLLYILLHLSFWGLSQPEFSVWKEFGIQETFYPEAIIQDKEGYIWVGSRTKGLMVFDGVKVYEYSYDPQDLQTINSNYITNLQEWNNYIVGSTKANGWFLFDKRSHVSQRFNTETIPSLQNQWVEDMYLRGDSLYIASYNGLIVQDLISKEVQAYPIPFNLALDRPKANEIMCIEPSPENKDILYLGTTMGLFTFNISSKKYKNLKMPLSILNSKIKDDKGILPIQVRDIIVNNNGVLYMATWGGGLLIMNPHTKQWKRYDFEPNKQHLESALSHNISDNTFWINDDTLLVSSNHQVHLFDINKQQLFPLNQESSWRADGAGYYCYDFTFLHDSSIIITNDKTLLRSRPKLVKKFKQIDIHYVIVDGQKTISKAFKNNEIIVEGKPKNLSIYFSYPDFNGNEMLQYKLDKEMAEWQIINSRDIQLTNLSKSDHLLIKTTDNTIFNIPIHVHIPLHLRWWFIPAIITGLFSIIGSFLLIAYKNKISKLKLTQEYEKKLSEMEMQTLRAQMNPHFLFNSLNSIKHYSLTKSPYETADYLSKFSLLIRKILHNSTHQLLPLDQELDTLKLYIEVESLRFEHRFDYQIKVDPNLQLSQIMVPPMILQPFVENAIWHGIMHLEHKGQLDINLKDTNDSIVVTIQDNGIGREEARKQKHKFTDKAKSYGIDITQSRIDLIERIHGIRASFNIDDLYNNDGVAIGTKVTLHIPKIIE